MRIWIAATILISSVIAGGAYMFYMPEKSFQGPLPVITQQEINIRDRARAHIEKLALDIGERNMWHYAELLQASDYIEDVFNDMGYSVEEQVYVTDKKNVRNIFVIKHGDVDPDENIIVGAHYDSVFGSPGANDNGTGVAALLEIARYFKDRKTKKTIRFVAFVNEEPPFFYSRDMGSWVYAKKLREHQVDVTAMLSLETIGYYSDEPGSQKYPFFLNRFFPDKANFIGFVSNLKSRPLLHQVIKSFRENTQFPSEGIAAPMIIPGIGWSDQWSFWNQGYPGIMVTDTALFRYPQYHSSEDLSQYIDADRMARVILGVAKVIEDLAN